MKTFATVVLALVVCATAFFGFFFTICAATPGMADRGSFVIADVIDIAIMIGAIIWIAKLNRRPPNP